MTPHRISLRHLVILTALVLAGCSKSGGITGPDPSAGKSQSPFRGGLAAGASDISTLQGHEFVPRSDNPYFPLVPGATFRYRSETADGVEDEVFTVTRDTKKINGVTTRVIEDVVRLDGKWIERTFDYFASDELGNVWYFGEDARSRDLETGEVSTEGSWRAGRDGAEAGIIMEAHPQVNDVYHEENAPGVAEDQARVLALGAPANVPAGSYGNCLQTENFSALSPGTEHKFYAPGVGLVLEIDLTDNTRNELVKVKQPDLRGDDRDEKGDGDDDDSLRNLQSSRITVTHPVRRVGGGAR